MGRGVFSPRKCSSSKVYVTLHLHVSLIFGAILPIFVCCLTQIKFMALTGLQYTTDILSLLSMVRLPRLNAVVKSDGAQYRAGASHFRLVRPLRCEEARGVWGHVPPGTLRSLLRPCSGQNATRITPPVVSVAIEPSCQKYLHARRAC